MRDSDPEEIIYEAVADEMYSGDGSARLAAKDAIRALRLAGWIRSVDGRNRAIGLSDLT